MDRRAFLGGAAGALGIGALAALVGCTPARPEPVPSDEGVDPAVTVRVVDNAYQPAEVTVAAGEAVRWEFVGPGEHDVVSNDRSFVSELQKTGSYTHVFESAGDFAYLCSIHPEMRGVVHVG